MPSTAICAQCIEHLAALEINDVWVEAGAGLNGALLHAGLIDELIIYMAPRLLGDSARGMFAVPPLEVAGERPASRSTTSERSVPTCGSRPASVGWRAPDAAEECACCLRIW